MIIHQMFFAVFCILWRRGLELGATDAKTLNFIHIILS